MATTIYTGGTDAEGDAEVVSPPPKLNRVLNSVSSVLTLANVLTIGQNDAKIIVIMRIWDSRPLAMSVLGPLFLLLALSLPVYPQKIVDKTVATVSDGFRTEWITLSDIRWEIALQRGSVRPPFTSEDLNAALQKLIEQRTFSLEAKRLPRNQVSKAEVDAEINRIMEGVSAAQFESKLREVGFATVSDPEFQRIIEERLAIEKYLTFRFRSFIVVTPKDEETYYREVWVPEFRRKYPDLMVPTLEQKRANIHDTLVELRVEADMQTFLDNAKQRVTVVIISPV